VNIITTALPSIRIRQPPVTMPQISYFSPCVERDTFHE